ncbi:MAG TPA: tetratricopeptide repeat protein [Myxococcota bacterium]|nr:tetratricopeptide repeat protein [Myxococcota bacterium]
MSTPRPHGDTQTPLEGFEARLQDAFAWANEHGREITAGLLIALLVGAIAAGVFEWRSQRREAAETEFAEIGTRFASAMGSTADDYYVQEPANAEQAKKAREAALAEFDAFAAQHAGTPLAALAGIKAAELEVDLGQLDAADTRLQKLAESLDPNDPRRAIALRLRGYALDQKGQTLAAGEAYEAAARVESYAARALVWISAGDAYARANEPARAIASYREAIAESPDLAQGARLVDRMAIQQAKLDAAAPPALAAPAATEAAPPAK